ncbi:trypsin zeta-like [Rhagoletis pomonella]|uniref:trypsin zeta-like n=1 Tax=Rhagoletis pomonella TaxID=28610 RepID=UPI00178385D3|nr:trypsin zeta-like [Rhagoletis pomonella]
MKFITIFGTILALALAGTTLCAPHSEADTSADTTAEGRIVGGNTIDISVHPHQVTLRVKSLLYPTNSYSHNCGGSIVSAYTIVTAAHCVIARVASEYQVVAGTNHRRGADGIISVVKEIIMNENYNPSTIDNDIALLVLATPLPINNFTIKPVELADVPSLNGATATVTGWGTLVQGGSSPNLLQEVKVPIVSNELCDQDYGSAGLITDSMLCAGVRGVGGKDACQGDSGGPLLVNGKLAGVVSWGYGCADYRYPGVYSNVTHLLPWLREKIAAIDATFLREN